MQKEKLRIVIDGCLPKGYDHLDPKTEVSPSSRKKPLTPSPSSRNEATSLTRSDLKSSSAFFASRSSARIGVPFREVTIILQNDAESDAAHRAIMGVEGATDVITQRYEAIPPEPSGVYGELYVNCDQALRVAPKRRGWSPAKELLLYIAHGMDHLSGADDCSPDDYARMRRRELQWLRSLYQQLKK